MKKLNLCNMLYIFVIASIFGWIAEVVFNFIVSNKLVNPTAVVIGPFNMAYGICACVLTILLIKYKDSSYTKLFLIGFIGGSIIEYIMSLGMELVLGFVTWDYSERFLNINGRICLLFSIFWGILGIVWIKICYPFMIKIIEKIKENFRKKLAIFILIFLILDILFTVNVIIRARAFEKGIPARNSYESFLDKNFNSEYLRKMYGSNWK